jgi:hypothetical protein
MYLASVVAASEVGAKITALRKDMKSKSGQASELALEKQRLDLLASEDPAERAKGEAMVTPASIVLAESDQSAYVPAELTGQTLGDIPDDASFLGENAPVAEKDSFAAAEDVEPVDPSAAEGFEDCHPEPGVHRLQEAQDLRLAAHFFPRRPGQGRL